jgi:glucose/arabinose dehydrogenase
MKNILVFVLPLTLMLCIGIACGSNSSGSQENKTAGPATAPAKTESTVDEENAPPVPGDVQLKLPAGFAATEVSPGVGRARHLVVASNGLIYVKMANAGNNKGIIVLKDKNGDGIADETTSFGNYGGTGITIHNGYLYTTSDEEVFRYKMGSDNLIINPAKPERIVTGLLVGSQHTSKSIALDDKGNIYVTIGAPSNACQVMDRTKGSPGQDPCPLLEKAGGVWQFKTDKSDQSYPQGIRYASGIRNIVGIDWNKSQNQLYAMQHGRDQLSQLWPQYYNDEQSAELPGEEMLLVKKGSNFGWPYCYFDQNQNKKLLAPEYGGNGKTTGRCEGVELPLMAFPGHWAPNDIMFYTGTAFPEHYRNGAFICFHGSWNRAPLKQAGYFVAYVPFKNGKPSGPYEVFADGFAGVSEIRGPGQAKHRPMGLAMGPDGSIYISDSVKGTIWKISYKK